MALFTYFFSTFLLPTLHKFRFIWSEWLIIIYMGHTFENFCAFESVIEPFLKCLLGIVESVQLHKNSRHSTPPTAPNEKVAELKVSVLRDYFQLFTWRQALGLTPEALG